MASEYVYKPNVEGVSFDSALEALQKRFPDRRIEYAWVPFPSNTVTQKVTEDLRRLGIEVRQFQASIEEFEEFRRQADYSGRYASYYSSNQLEKSFEHFIAAKLLVLQRSERFIDVASEGSPLPEIFHRLYGAESYAQDIMYPAGIQCGRIGGDASDMPAPDAFADAAALTCSLEHFEGDSDTRLFVELGRILRKAGRMVVAPLYMYTSPAVQTDPCYCVSADVSFDEGATIFCAENWTNRHGRFYSAETLVDRVIKPAKDRFTFRVFVLGEPIVNEESSSKIYGRFALLAEKT